eukprot:scaffold10865_cov67-Attheya_sp.AAC.3
MTYFHQDRPSSPAITSIITVERPSDAVIIMNVWSDQLQIGNSWKDSIPKACPGGGGDGVMTIVTKMLKHNPPGMACNVDKRFLIDNVCTLVGVICIRLAKSAISCRAEIRWHGATDIVLVDVWPNVELWGAEDEIKQCYGVISFKMMLLTVA